MAYKSIDFLCPDCGHFLLKVLVDRADPQPYTHPCESCGASMKEAFLSTTMNLKASYPDGRKNQVARDLAQASRLEGQAANMAPDKRGDINREINRLRGKNYKKPGN